MRTKRSASGNSIHLSSLMRSSASKPQRNQYYFCVTSAATTAEIQPLIARYKSSTMLAEVVWLHDNRQYEVLARISICSGVKQRRMLTQIVNVRLLAGAITEQYSVVIRTLLSPNIIVNQEIRCSRNIVQMKSASALLCVRRTCITRCCNRFVLCTTNLIVVWSGMRK